MVQAVADWWLATNFLTAWYDCQSPAAQTGSRWLFSFPEASKSMKGCTWLPWPQTSSGRRTGGGQSCSPSSGRAGVAGGRALVPVGLNQIGFGPSFVAVGDLVARGSMAEMAH